MQDVRQLSTLFHPDSYQLSLTIDRLKRRFTGTAVITGELVDVATEIILHAKELEIAGASVDGAPLRPEYGENDELHLRGENEIQSGQHTLKIQFAGTVNTALHGLYLSTYMLDGVQKEMLVTQFESHSAREMFPCIDEPAAKAVFRLNVRTEKEVEVISNTPIESQKTEDVHLVTAFEETPRMSTYLLALVVGELEHLEAKTRDGVIVRTYATKGQAQHTQFALDTALRALSFYNDFFGIPYPLPKCDLIAVPDFSAGAMENWGLITARESCLLVDEHNTDIDSKQFVAVVVIHELAHQWFGNLVTMQWWNDLWLNEGFARFMESYVGDVLFPEWRMSTDFLATNTALAERLDALASTHPVQVPIHHPDEIPTIFDAISYEKGAAVIYMLYHYLGEELFRKGLQRYMDLHKGSNTVTVDLWNALADVSRKDVRGFMDVWVTQPGFPVVGIEESDDTLTLTQARFFSSATERTKDTAHMLWPIPLLGNQAYMPELLDADRLRVTGLKKSIPLKLNQGQFGFYFTHYTKPQYAALREAIEHDTLAIEDRLGLLNEVFELAKAGYQSTVDALTFLEGYAHETDVHVWSVISTQLAAIRLLIDVDEQDLKHFDAYTVTLIRDQLSSIGWEQTKDEPDTNRLLRQMVLNLGASAREESVIRTALSYYDKALKPEDIPVDVRALVYAIAVCERGEEVIVVLLERYEHTAFAEERVNLMTGICAAKDMATHKQTLAFIKAKVKSQDLSRWFMGLLRNRYARETTWQWIQDNWQWIVDQFEGDFGYSNYPKYVAQVLSTNEQLARYRAFFEPKKKDPALKRTIEQGLETIAFRQAWYKEDIQSLRDYLEHLTD
jgi:aminopeptidase N